MKKQNDIQALNKYLPDFVRSLEDGHPVRVYYTENFYLRRVLQDLERASIQIEIQEVFNIFNQISEVEKKFARKENQLFPFLEKKGWNGPSQGMWAFHDDIREKLREIRKKFETSDLGDINQKLKVVSVELQRLMAVEESRLFPIALEMLSKDEWQEMSFGEKEIGWILNVSPVRFSNQNFEEPSITSGIFKMNEGRMSLEQINLMLKVIPVDLTYVDENDRVIFYNRGESRVFPRSAGIIGREVRFCHPPKSVGTVLKILEEFKKGTRNEADFWIRFKGRVIHIRYFAVRTEDGAYKGVMEMSQDITEIQKLEGEQRLLSWNSDSE